MLIFGSLRVRLAGRLRKPTRSLEWANGASSSMWLIEHMGDTIRLFAFAPVHGGETPSLRYYLGKPTDWDTPLSLMLVSMDTDSANWTASSVTCGTISVVTLYCILVAGHLSRDRPAHPAVPTTHAWWRSAPQIGHVIGISEETETASMPSSASWCIYCQQWCLALWSI